MSTIALTERPELKPVADDVARRPADALARSCRNSL
jgi:hypothetical protein